MKGNNLYLHVFEWGADGMLTLPSLPRKVLACRGLGGEDIGCTQTGEHLLLKRTGSKATEVHSAVKLTLAPGEAIPLIAVG